jgi:nitronate monooxygenase
MGTRFMATDEAPIHRNVKEQIVANDERGTILVFREFRNTARVARNTISEEIARISAQPGATFADIAELASGERGRREVYANGDVEGGMWWASQAQGLIHDIAPVKDVVDRIISDAAEIVSARLDAQLVN